jgi:hypothetical protein
MREAWQRLTKSSSFLQIRELTNRLSFLPVAEYILTDYHTRQQKVSTLPDDPDATYLPERYRQQVKTKKQRRIYKKLVIGAGVIVIIIVAYVLLSSMLLSPQPFNPLKSPVTPLPTTGEKTPAPEVNVTVSVTPGYILGTGISTLNSADVLTLNDAVSFLRLDFPEKTYELISANLTDRYAGHRLYEFTIHAADSPAGTGILV